MKITKLKYNGRDIYENTAIAKLNEVIDAINDHKQQLNNHLCRILALEDPDKPEHDQYAEQRKWIGKLCWFWDIYPEGRQLDILVDINADDTYTPYETDTSYFHSCEPVKPDDDVIYKKDK